MRESFLLNLALLHALRRMPALTSRWSSYLQWQVMLGAGSDCRSCRKRGSRCRSCSRLPRVFRLLLGRVVISPDPFLCAHTTGLSCPSAKPLMNSTTRINRFITPLPPELVSCRGVRPSDRSTMQKRAMKMHFFAGTPSRDGCVSDFRVLVLKSLSRKQRRS